MNREELEVEKALNKMVKMGYLKKTKRGYMDSDYVKSMLKKGKTREEIDKLLRIRAKQALGEATKP